MFRLTILSLLVVFSLLSLGFGGGIVNAQSEPDWCYTFDFTSQSYATIGSSAGWYQTLGDGWSSDNGWESENFPLSGVDGELNYVYLDLPSSYSITDFDMTFSSVSTQFPPPGGFIVFNGDSEIFRTSAENVNINQTWYNSSFTASTVSTTNNPRSATDWWVSNAYLAGNGTPPYPSLENECDTGDELVQPIRAINRNSHNQITEHPTSGIDDVGLVTRANDPLTNIHAIVDGTVSAIDELEPSDCNDFFYGNDWSSGSFACPAVWSDSVLMDIDTVDAQIVHILSDSGVLYKQMVNNADNYVTMGQTVTAGCWIGRAVVAQDVQGNIQNITATWSMEDDGITYSTVSINEIPIAPEPPESNACNTPDGYTQCLGDYNVRDSSKWNATGTVQNNLSGGVVLFPGSSIAGTFNLDSTREPKLTIGQWNTPSQVTLQLGQTTLTTTFQYGKAGIDASTHSPDAGSLYTVKITNSGQTMFGLDYICVEHTKDDAGDPIPDEPTTPDPGDPIPPDNNPADVDTCAFFNHAFNYGSESWTISAGVEPTTGGLNVPDNETISQSVTITETSTLSIIASLWTFNNFAFTETLTRRFELEYDTGSGYTVIDNPTLGEFALNNNVMVYQASVASFSGDITIKADLVGAQTGVRGITIQSVCLNADDTVLPTADDVTGIFEAQCDQQIPTATGEDLFTWIPWLWSHLNKFFQCDLMIILNEMYRISVDFFNLFGWVSRYGMGLADMSIDWFGQQFVPWLDGHLSNIAVAAGGFDEVSPECDLFFCTIYEGFDLIGSLIELVEGLLGAFLEFIQGMIDFGLQVLNAIFNILNSFRAFFDAVISAYLQAEPADFPFLPTCSINRKSSGFCILLWILENTVLSGSGALFIPLLISYGGIMWLLWAIIEIKKVVNQAARAF